MAVAAQPTRWRSTRPSALGDARLRTVALSGSDVKDVDAQARGGAGCGVLFVTVSMAGGAGEHARRERPRLPADCHRSCFARASMVAGLPGLALCHDRPHFSDACEPLHTLIPRGNPEFGPNHRAS
jgi:hypothetical protein